MEPVHREDGIQSEVMRLEEITSPFMPSHVNELHASWSGVLEGSLDPAVFHDRITSEKERFSSIFNKFLEIYTKGPLPEIIRDEMGRIHSTLLEYGKTLEEMESYFESHDPQIIGAGLSRLTSIMQSAGSSYKMLLNFNTKICPQCQGKNSSEELICQNCGAFFTLTGEEIPLAFTLLAALSKTIPVPRGTFPLAESLIEAYQDFGKLSSGSLPMETYIEHLDMLIIQCELSRKKLERAQYSKPPEALQFEDFRAAELLFDAIDTGRNALDKLHDKIILESSGDLSTEWNSLIRSVHLILHSPLLGGTGSRPE